MVTERELLASDLVELRRVISDNESVLHILGDTTDPVRHSYLEVVVDLFWRVMYHCWGVNVLLHEELRDPLIATERALFETLVTLGYLTYHPQREREALILRAFGYLKQLHLFADQASVVEERQRILVNMPQDVLAEARRRLESRPRTWSGKTIRTMAQEAKVIGYEGAYDYLSAEAHVTIVGERVTLQPLGDGTARVSLGRKIPDKEAETFANFARRALWHSSARMWEILGGPKISLSSPHPDAWDT